MITEPAHELTFGDLLLTGDLQDTDYQFQVLGEDADTGNPEPVEQTVASLLQDGALVVTRSHGNREATFQITIEAGDSVALAEGEQALFLECSKPNTLSWTPPDGLGATSVFEVFTSSLEHAFNDSDELYVRRTYRLRLVCHPFTRSVDEVVTPALATGTASTVTISDGTSATGWASTLGTVTVASSRLIVPDAYTSSGKVPGQPPGTTTYFGTANATRTMSATDFTVTRYVTVEVTFAVTGGTLVSVLTPTLLLDGVAADLVSTDAITDGYKYGFLVAADASATTLALTVPFWTRGTSAPAATVRLDNVIRTDTQPGLSSTGRSSLRAIDVDGSARTQGSLHISHATGGLGDTIVYTTPVLDDTAVGYRPDLAHWQVGGRTPDATTISGDRGGASYFEVPIGSVPAGGHVFVVRVNDVAGADTVTFRWTAATVIGGVTLATVTSAEVTVEVDGWANVILPGLVLPPVEVPSESEGVLAIQLLSDAAPGVWEWDEAWSFYMGDDDSALTIVRAGAGAESIGVSHSQLWLDGAVAGRPRPAIYLGTADDRSDAFNGGSFADAWGVHTFRPGQVLVYVADSGATFPSVELTHFPRWFTHAVS